MPETPAPSSAASAGKDARIKSPFLEYLGDLLPTETVESDEDSLQEVLDFMQKSDVFVNVPHFELPILARAFTTRIVHDGEVIVKQGELGHELFFIHSGKVVVKRESEGEELEVGILKEGDYFGETALLTNAPRNASAYAQGDEISLRVLSRETFEELGMHGKMVLQTKYAELSNGFDGVCKDVATLHNLLKLVISLGIYIGSSCLVLPYLEDWPFYDCVYFCLITLLTVGYGDLSPKHELSRLWVSAWIMVSLLFVATSIGDFLEHLVTKEIANDKARKALCLHEPRQVEVFDHEGLNYNWQRRFMKCLVAIISIMGMCTVTARFMMQLDWVDAYYFSVITLTTIGYGDIVPETPRDKCVFSFITLIGVPAFGTALARIVEIVYGKARGDHIHTVSGGLTNEKFNHFVDFCEDMKRMGAYNSKPRESRRDQITPFEFLCFILTKNESVSLHDIKAIMDNFTELNTSGSGFLSREDLEEWQRRGATNPSNMNMSSRHSTRSSRMLPPGVGSLLRSASSLTGRGSPRGRGSRQT